MIVQKIIHTTMHNVFIICRSESDENRQTGRAKWLAQEV